jgi:hypothetical protein
MLGFDLKEESLGEIFDKLEIMLTALGFVLDGKMLNLVDKDSPERSNWESKFLAETNTLTTCDADDRITLTVHPGGKE